MLSSINAENIGSGELLIFINQDIWSSLYHLWQLVYGLKPKIQPISIIGWITPNVIIFSTDRRLRIILSSDVITLWFVVV
jgi:hypothetical protein